MLDDGKCIRNRHFAYRGKGGWGIFTGGNLTVTINILIVHNP